MPNKAIPSKLNKLLKININNNNNIIIIIIIIIVKIYFIQFKLH